MGSGSLRLDTGPRKSMIGFAGRSGIAVEPTCSTLAGESGREQRFETIAVLIALRDPGGSGSTRSTGSVAYAGDRG